MIRELFDDCANAYDRDRKKLVPCFDELYGTAVRVMPFSESDDIDVLDLGAGTGLFAEMISRRYPGATLHLTDISGEMLNQARRRFRGDRRVSFSVQDHLSLGDSGAYDLVISALSIHHLENPAKRELFRKIYRSLRPGGLFVNVDQALGPGVRGEELYEGAWLRDVRESGVSEGTLEKAKERMKEDRNASLSDQLGWLSEAGFEGIDCWYKRFRFVVYGGYRGA